MLLPWTVVDDDELIKTPNPVLPEMMLVGVPVPLGPPISVPTDEATSTPVVFGMTTVPAGSVPMKLPWTTAPASDVRFRPSELPETTLPTPAAVPPTSGLTLWVMNSPVPLAMALSP